MVFQSRPEPITSSFSWGNIPMPHRIDLNMEDIRWKRRFDNFIRALQTLRSAVELSRQHDLSELEQRGLIQGFEFTHELAWNVLKDYLEAQGFVGIIGSKNAARE